MNLQLLKIRTKGRQVIVLILKYTLLSSIILKSFHPAYLPVHSHLSFNLETLRHKLFTHEALYSPHHCVHALCVDGAVFNY